MPFAQHRRLHTFFMMNVFACMGLSTEVVFTALMSVINQEPHCGKPLIALAGYTYVWMVFIYASIPLLGYFFFDKIKHRPLFVRLLTYTVFVYVIEFFPVYYCEHSPEAALGNTPQAFIFWD